MRNEAIAALKAGQVQCVFIGQIKPQAGSEAKFTKLNSIIPSVCFQK